MDVLPDQRWTCEKMTVGVTDTLCSVILGFCTSFFLIEATDLISPVPRLVTLVLFIILDAWTQGS